MCTSDPRYSCPIGSRIPPDLDHNYVNKLTKCTTVFIVLHSSRNVVKPPERWFLSCTVLMAAGNHGTPPGQKSQSIELCSRRNATAILWSCRFWDERTSVDEVAALVEAVIERWHKNHEHSKITLAPYDWFVTSSLCKRSQVQWRLQKSSPGFSETFLLVSSMTAAHLTQHRILESRIARTEQMVSSIVSVRLLTNLAEPNTLTGKPSHLGTL